MSVGHPQLVAAIAEEIRRIGPITFARFMDLALYHPEYGYYMRPLEPDRERIGWSGDFYTSSDVHPALARALVRQILQIDEHLGSPRPFTVVEMGPGKGLLAREFLSGCQHESASFLDRLHYVLIERSPAMRGLQRINLAPWLGDPGPLSWLDSLEALGSGCVTGAMLSNELVDAFPVHRLRYQGGEPKEIHVEYRGGRFGERLGPLSSPDLSRYLERLASLGLVFSDGYTTEINLDALRWIRSVARVLGRGLVITIDYGHTAQDLYTPARPTGTLVCYHHQTASDDPYLRVGLQDITAHVDFSSLATAGEEAGLRVTGFTNQMSFLIGLGVEQTLEELEPGAAEFQSLVHLLRPDGMGRTFKILIQHKDMEPPELDGLQFKPFFGTALAARASGGHKSLDNRP